MTPSSSIETFIKGYEKCRLTAFKPTPNDKWTIGWGRTAGVTPGMKQTQAEADADFDQNMRTFGDGVLKMIGAAPTTQGQFDALVSLAYNIGLSNFRGSSVLTNHRAGHYQTAALAFKLWNKQRNKKTGLLEVLSGLTKRRAAEALIYGAK